MPVLLRLQFRQPLYLVSELPHSLQTVVYELISSAPNPIVFLLFKNVSIFKLTLKLPSDTRTPNQQIKALSLQRGVFTFSYTDDEVIINGPRLDSLTATCCLCSEPNSPVLTTEHAWLEHLRGHVQKQVCLACDMEVPLNHSCKPQKPNTICEICGRKFSTWRALSYHMNLHTNDKPFKCSLCPKKFAARSTCVVHQKTHQGTVPTGQNTRSVEELEEELAERGQATTGTASREFICSACGIVFSEGFKLSQHKKNVHSNQLYQCTTCSKTFKTKGNLQLHSAKHITGTSFSCLVCSKTFPYRTLVYRHVMTAHTEKKKKESPGFYIHLADGTSDTIVVDINPNISSNRPPGAPPLRQETPGTSGEHEISSFDDQLDRLFAEDHNVKLDGEEHDLSFIKI